jgi:hypothetical protein
LESVCWGNSTVGSNPTLSAILISSLRHPFQKITFRSWRRRELSAGNAMTEGHALFEHRKEVRHPSFLVFRLKIDPVLGGWTTSAKTVNEWPPATSILGEWTKMKAMQDDELRKWLSESHSPVKIDPSRRFHYSTHCPIGLRLNIPPEAQRAVALASAMLSLEDDDGYYGSLLYFANWDIGTPRIERCGLRMLEQMRRGYGVTASIENAPAQLFRTDEIVDALAFFALPMLFGWSAYFSPHGTQYFAYIRENGSLFLVTESEEVLLKLQSRLDAYGPVLELPSYLENIPS